MKSRKRKVLSLALASLCAPHRAHSQSEASQPDYKALAAQYVAAFNAKDLARIEALYDPKWLACITPANKDYYDGALESEWRDPIPANYTLTVRPVNQSNLKALESMGRPPVEPDREMQVDYQQGDDSGSLILYVVHENGRLLVDNACVNDQAIRKFHDEAPARAELLAQRKALEAAIHEPLRSQLIAMLRAHETGEATKRYKEASGQDYPTAMYVMYLLAHEPK